LTPSSRRSSNVVETQIESCFPLCFFPAGFTGLVYISGI
jgi:hypothetical protein